MADLDIYRVIDGGLATELEFTHNFKITGDPLWSARLIKENADIIKQAHTSFLVAGADLIETASYQASIEGLVTHLNVSVDEAVQILRKSVDICKCAVEEFWSVPTNRSGRIKPLVVGSLGPFGAHLADCSEYNGNYVDTVSIQEMMDWHRPQARALIDAGIDLIAFETLPAQKEAEALVQLLKEFPSCKAWISFSCKDGTHTCHGEHIADATAAAAASDQVIAVGVNCTPLYHISDLLSNISDSVKQNKSIVVYPNVVEGWPNYPTKRSTDEKITSITDTLVGEWTKRGAKWIGGCCCATPADIAVIRSHLKRSP